MEDLNDKLNSGNSVIISQVISKLLLNIKSQQKEDITEAVEFKLLKEKCISNNKSVNSVAAEAILRIARSGNSFLAKSILTDFVTIITTTRCSPNITFLINNLLLTDLQNELSINSRYKSVYNLRLPQHPLIILLSEDSDCWSFILKEITLSYETAASSVVSHYDELYKPLFLYTLCSPQGDNLLIFKQKLWTFILHKESLFKRDEFIICLLKWMQFEIKDAIEVNSDLLIELTELNKHQQIIEPSLLILWQVSALHQLILNNLDPRFMIISILNYLQEIEDYAVLNPVLLILSKSVSLCSSVYLTQLLKLCKAILSKAICDPITKNIVKYVLLQWIANPSDIISEALDIANNIFSFLQSNNGGIRMKGYKSFYENYKESLIANTEIYFSLKTYILLESWKNDEDIKLWIDKLEKAPTFFITSINEFLIALFLTNFKDITITKKAFNLILKCVDYNKFLATNVLTVILFKLTSTTDSNLHFCLLKAIPKMGVIKSNFRKIASTIQALSKGGSTMKTFSAILMLDLWKINNKCYPLLENFLMDPCAVKTNRWEFYVTRAHILKELCDLKPELHGKEIVAHLSRILNECNHSDGAVPCALAIDGITLLCRSEIIDAVTTWATLAPMFKTESRIPVIKSICSLIAEIPSLSYSETYPQLIQEVISQLWNYMDMNSTDEVWKYALSSMAHFQLDEIVAQIPERYLDDDSLTLRKSGHAVPGYCWIHFLKNCSKSKLNIVGDFLIKLVSIEIANYLKFVYQVKGTHEPIDYSYLPINSVVRGICTYIKSKLLKWKGSQHKEVYLQCLRIFSQTYSRPLPPLDWCFLQEVFHEPEAKEYCISIAAHQVVLSGTARRFIVNYIEALTQNQIKEEDALLIYSNLKFLANSIQPFTLKPFLEATVNSALNQFKTANEEFLLNILKYIETILTDKDIQEANKIVNAEIISDIFNDTEISSKLFDVLLESVIQLPRKCINDLSSPKTVKQITPEWFKKAIRLRCSLAVNGKDASLNLLNEIIEYGSIFPELKMFIFEQLALVFGKHNNNTECVLWVLELIGQIQAATAEKTEKKEILFLSDIFILATLVFSGHFVFLKGYPQCEEMYNLFPRAVTTLLNVNHWSICTNQALDWFYHMSTEKMFSKQYKNMFIECLQSLKHETEFYKNMKWTKYLNVEC